MKIRFVTEGNLHEFAQAGKTPPATCSCSGSNGLGDVDYRSELAGESSRPRGDGGVQPRVRLHRRGGLPHRFVRDPPQERRRCRKGGGS